jgi:hypothetical protein
MKGLRSTPQEQSYFVVDTANSENLYSADKKSPRNHTTEHTELLIHQRNLTLTQCLHKNNTMAETDDDGEFVGV